MPVMPLDPKVSQMLLEVFKGELRDLHQALSEDLLALEKAQSKEDLEKLLSQLFRYAHNMKGAAASASVDEVALMAHRMEDLFTTWRTTQHSPDKEQISACLQVADNLLQVFDSHCRGESIDVATFLKPLSNGQTVVPAIEDITKVVKYDFIKLPLSRLERATAKANEFINYQLKLDHWFKDMGHILRELRRTNEEQSPWINTLSTIVSDGGQFVGEFARTVGALQDELKTMRMLPISTILIPLNRTVRQVASALDKSVELQIEGADIELDKTILDAIKDPLQHLIRNAIDHGIEPNTQRQQLHKPVPATLILRITQLAGKIKLELLDDGQGIDLEQIKAHALAMGLYTEEALQALSEEDILACLFVSGFSMHEQVTEISGRGIGLDVVKNNVEKINGSIAVATKWGQGSCFTLTLPLTLATTRGIFFKVNEQLFMLPTISLKALYAIHADEIKFVDNRAIWMIAHKPVPIIVLSQLLQMQPTFVLEHRIYHGIVIEHHEQEILLLIDNLLDEHACVVKPLPFPYSQLEHYIGVTLTGENNIVLVLDPVRLAQMVLGADAPRLTPISHAFAETKVLHKKRILVVDDSLTARALCANAIEAAGYEVTGVSDGKKAWEQLQKERFDGVITDILMPVMDGFELTTRIKKHKTLNSLPVIIISALDSQKDKQRGLEAGANAFIVKSEFDTRALIDVMESLL